MIHFGHKGVWTLGRERTLVEAVQGTNRDTAVGAVLTAYCQQLDLQICVA